MLSGLRANHTTSSVNFRAESAATTLRSASASQVRMPSSVSGGLRLEAPRLKRVKLKTSAGSVAERLLYI